MEKDVTTSTDIIIIGGGLVGATLAKALSTLDLRVALIEKKFASDNDDSRALALNFGTLGILKRIFAIDFSSLGALVKNIYVSDHKGFGRVHLNAADEDLPYFGCVVPIVKLTEILQQQVLADPKIYCITGECTGLSQDDSGVSCEVFGVEHIKAKLVIGADGAHSRVREFLNISHSVKDFQQTALIGNVKVRGIDSNTAYERFTAEGPLALLPFDDEHMTLVWVMPNKIAEMRQTLPLELLLEDLQKIMGYRAGKFVDLGKLRAYPLVEVIADKIYQGCIGLLGNAAHSLHPVAAQGFNLSVRDIFGFYQVMQRYQDLLSTSPMIWQEYMRVRHHDQARTVRLTHVLLQVFTQKNPLVQIVRNSLMLDLELCPPIKTALNDVMVGLT